MVRRYVWAALAVAVLGSVLGISDAQAKANVVEVQAGAVHPTNKDAPYEYIRYYPDTVRVHPGQTVRWKLLGFHTVTFAKAGRTGFFRRDELPNTYTFPDKTFLGTGCGQFGACVVNKRSTFVSSPMPVYSFDHIDIKIDLPPGTYTYFCQIHPLMNGSVAVVKAGAPLPSQKQLNAQIASEVRKDSGATDATFKADQVPSSKIDANGVRTWQVLLGDTDPKNHVQILTYLPTDLSIGAGDRVHYVFRDRAIHDIHTVTFPTQLAGGFNPMPHGLAGFAIYLSCDGDGPTTGAPGVFGLWGMAVAPPCPADLEGAWAPWMIDSHPAIANAVTTPATYHDSGVLAPKRHPKSFKALPDTGRVFPSSFDAEFPLPGEFTYECDIHAEVMTGSISVS